MLICVERVSLGYTVLPTILGVSSLPSQSQPRTQWCSAPLTGGIPRNCCYDAGLNSSESLLSLSHLLLPFSSPWFLSCSLAWGASTVCVWIGVDPHCSQKTGYIGSRQLSSSPLSLLLPLSSVPGSTSHFLSLSLFSSYTHTLSHTTYTHSLLLPLSLSKTPFSYSWWVYLPIRVNRFGAEGVLLLPGKRAFPLWAIPEVRCLLLVCVCVCVFVAGWMCVDVSVSGWHNQDGWVLWEYHREVHFATTPSPSLWHNFCARSGCTFQHNVHRKAFCVCLIAGKLLSTGRCVAGISRSAATYRACFWLRGETMVWMCGRMERRGVGNGDERRAAAFILGKLISPFVHLSIR